MKTWTEWSQSLSSPKKRSRLSLTHAGDNSLSTRSVPGSASVLTSSPAGGWKEVVLRWWVLTENTALDSIQIPHVNHDAIYFFILVSSFIFFHDVRSQGFCLLICPPPPSPSHLPEVYLFLVYSTSNTLWAQRSQAHVVSCHRKWGWYESNPMRTSISFMSVCFLLPLKWRGWWGSLVAVDGLGEGLLVAWEEMDGSI